jgi:hypothetical protein
LMIMGGRLTRYVPKIGEAVEKWEKLWRTTSDPRNPEIIKVNPQRKLYGLKH